MLVLKHFQIYHTLLLFLSILLPPPPPPPPFPLSTISVHDPPLTGHLVLHQPIRIPHTLMQCFSLLYKSGEYTVCYLLVSVSGAGERGRGRSEG